MAPGGSYIETCSCGLTCRANLSFDDGATYDFCRVVLVFNIREGEIEGTDIGGMKVVAVADTPKVMTDGNWRLGVFIDERASDEQAGKLVQVFGGQLGGPMAGVVPLVGEMLGVERAAIEVHDDGLRHSVRVGDVIDFEIEDIVPFGVETGEPVRFAGMFHPVASNLTMAEAKRSRIDAFGIAYEGKTASRHPSSPGRPDRVIARVSDGAPGGGGLAPAFAAARARLGLVALLFVLAGAGWWSTAGQMQGMDNGPWTGLGTLGWFLGVWVVMMAAMMFPSVAPTVALYSRMTRERSPLSPLLFAAGYLVTWGAAGVLAFSIAAAGGRIAGDVLAWDRAGRWVAGATLIVAAVYELTPLKDVCLGKCRSPLGLLLGSWRDGRSGALQMGAKNGAWCVGCCWALMASLFALGVMSILWMALVAGLIAAEKTRALGSGRDIRDGRDSPRARRAPARLARHDPRSRRFPAAIRCLRWADGLLAAGRHVVCAQTAARPLTLPHKACQPPTDRSPGGRPLHLEPR